MIKTIKIAVVASVSIAVFITGTLLGLFIYSVWPAADRELLFTNGDILTMENGVAEAILVRDGRIVALGSESDVAAQASPETDVVDLDGGTLMPGLVEPHTHPIATALLSATVDVSGFANKDRAEVMHALEASVDDFTPNGWIIAFGWDPVMLADLEAPTLAELDALSPDKPLIILTQMMHDAYANSAAFAAAGINRNTPNPEGGEFIKDAAGELSGTIREVSAINQMADAVPKPPNLAVTMLMQRQFQRYARAGYSSLGILGPVGRSENPLGLLAGLLDNDDAPVRAQTWALPTQLGSDDIPSGNFRYGLRGVKFWMDGSPFAGGAAWAEPYENSELVLKRLELPKSHMPELNFDTEAFEKQFFDLHQRGFSIAVHAQGERAIDQVLNVAERTLKAHPKSNHGHRLEHNALITSQQMARAKRLGIALSFFVDQVWLYGHRLPELVGDRSLRYSPLADALDLGHRISIHGDHPATSIQPFRSLKTAVTRSMRSSDGKLGADQALTIEQGLRAMTIDAAWQLGLDAEVGSLKQGKAADLVWLDRNPLSTAPDELDRIQVKATWVAGKPVDTGLFSQRNVEVFLNTLF